MILPITSNGKTPCELDREVAVKLSDVSVRYRVATERVSTLKEQFIRRVRGQHVDFQDYWALRDFSLEVPTGQTLGLIGRNGAGKSTLLKVIARVLSPTQGRVQIRGSVAPLIELGTGFHPELTGRENVFLNGAMLGFSRSEMQEKFDRIVEFAELAPFIDSPLRTYSSGMIVRLGFAIAVDIDPEILIVDEILAVGDIAFQKKCVDRMQEFREKGTTILFVSHSLTSIRELCESAVWIDRGAARQVGDVDEVIEAYRSSVSDSPQLWNGATLPEEQTRTQHSIFVDLPDAMKEGTHWMVEWIETAFRNGIVSECGQRPLRYCPQRPLTRAELAIFSLRARSWPSPPTLNIQAISALEICVDLPDEEKWMEPWLKQVVFEGIVPITLSSHQPYQFRQSVTRAELAVWLLKAKHGSEYLPPASTGVFSDVPADLKPEEKWMAPWIEQMYQQGITGGCAQTPLRYCSQRQVTRAEAAVFLLRTFNIS